MIATSSTCTPNDVCGYWEGLYDGPDDTETEHTFPLAVFKNLNPQGI